MNSVLVASPYGAEHGPRRTLEHAVRAATQAGYRPVCILRTLEALSPQLEALNRYEDYMLRISADMDEGFAGFEPDPRTDDQLVVCEICGMRVESEKKDEHLFENLDLALSLAGLAAGPPPAAPGP